MKEVIDVIVRLIRAGRQAYAKKWSFFGVFIVAFLASVTILGSLDLAQHQI